MAVLNVKKRKNKQICRRLDLIETFCIIEGEKKIFVIDGCSVKSGNDKRGKISRCIESDSHSKLGSPTTKKKRNEFWLFLATLPAESCL